MPDQTKQDIADQWERKRLIYRATHPGSPILFVLAMVTIALVGWQNDVASCQRSLGVRKALNAESHSTLLDADRAWVRSQHESGVLREQDLKAYRQYLKTAKELHVHQLNCSTSLTHLPSAR